MTDKLTQYLTLKIYAPIVIGYVLIVAKVITSLCAESHRSRVLSVKKKMVFGWSLDPDFVSFVLLTYPEPH